MRTLRTLLLSALVTACSDAVTSSPAGPPRSFTARVSYCAGLEPLWVAFQDGDGAWIQALPTTAGGNIEFRATFSAKRGAIATVAAGGAGITSLHVLYGTPAELETVGITGPHFCGPALTKTLLGTVAGLGSNEFAIVRGGFDAQALVLPSGGSDFALQALPSGPRDILAARTTRSNDVDALTGIILRRSIDLPDRATLPVFDFSSAEAFAPAVARVSIQGADGAGAFTTTRLLTSNMDADVSVLSAQTNELTKDYYALPETRLLPGDLQVLTASTSGATPAGARSAILYFRTPTDRTLALGAGLEAPVLSTVATNPSLRVRARFEPQSGYDRETSISYQEGATTMVIVSMTAAYAGLNGAGYDLVIPELTQLPGVEPAWALSPGQELRWSATRIGGTLGLGLDAVPSEGDTRRAALRGDTFLP